MGFIIVMCCPPPRGKYSCKAEKTSQDTLRIYTQQITFGKSDKLSVQQRQSTPEVIQAKRESHEQMLSTAASIPLCSWPDVRGRGPHTVYRGQQLSQTRANKSSFLDFRLWLSPSFVSTCSSAKKKKKKVLLQHNLRAIHQIRHRIN